MVALITTTFFSSAISSAMVGLAINYTLLVPVYLTWVVKFFADLETYMSAVERIEEFATIPIENYRNESKFLLNIYEHTFDIIFLQLLLQELGRLKGA